MKTRTQLDKRFFATLLFSALVLVFPNSPAANSFEDGAQAFVAGDYKKGIKIFKLLAEQGDVDAQITLGSIYKYGRGVRQDYAKAVKWYRKAAEQGNRHAQVLLGLHYQSGRGVRQDYAEAVNWYRKAAEQGDAGAQKILGFNYKLGRGVRQDYIEAHKWFNLAASRFPPGDDQKVAQENRDIVEKEMTPAQVAEAQKLAREWKPISGPN